MEIVTGDLCMGGLKMGLVPGVNNRTNLLPNEKDICRRCVKTAFFR